MATVVKLLFFSGLRLLAAICCLITIAVVSKLRQISKAPTDIPWVGLKNRRFFPKLRACLSELTAGRSMIDEGYEKYGKHGNAFILPGMIWIAVVLPPSNASWIAHQPDSILSGTTTMDDLTGFGYISHGPTAESCRDFTVIRRDLTRQIINLSDQVYEEIKAGLDERLSGVSKDEWIDVELQKVILDVAFQAGNRIFVGLPMCRDKKYKNAVDRWTAAFGFSTMMVKFVIPEDLRSLFFRIMAIPTKYLEWRASRFFIGRIKERLTRREKGEKGTDNDMMQWIIDQNASKNDSRELDPQNIAGKMILFNIFATATTGIQAGTTLHTLLSSEHAASLLAELQAEASQIMPQVEDDPRQIREMTILDSLIRESLRYHPMTPQGLIREVVKHGGITTPDGVYLPEGTHVQSLVKHMHHDVALFGEGADSFDPLRHLQQSTTSPEQEPKQRIAVQVSPDYLPWGLGKHACPGRFFAVHTMKLMLGHLFSGYELEPLQKKPKTLEIADMEFPSGDVVVRMRRRKVVADAAASRL